MNIKAKLLMKSGAIYYKQVNYNAAYLTLEIDGMRRIFEPRYFYKVGKEVLLELKEYTATKRGDRPRLNT